MLTLPSIKFICAMESGYIRALIAKILTAVRLMFDKGVTA
jgi:hypothetical protein